MSGFNGAFDVYPTTDNVLDTLLEVTSCAAAKLGDEWAPLSLVKRGMSVSCPECAGTRTTFVGTCVAWTS